MEFIMITNFFMILFIVVSVYQAWKYKDKMTDGAHHHFLSHLYIVAFLGISLNLYAYKGWVIPLLFSILHMLQHVTKENIRLIDTNKWTPTVKDI